MRTTRLMKAALTATFGLTLLLGPAAAGSAQVWHRDSDVLLPPSQRVDGMTGGQLLGQAWFYSYSLPVPENPLAGNFRCLHLGRTGRVMWVAGPITCTAPEGTKLLVYGASSACSNVEQPPYYGADETAQRACARASDQDSVSIKVSIDGGLPIDFREPRYEVFSPQLRVQLPPDNIVGVDPQPATFTAHGWVAVLTGLRPGLHTVQAERRFSDGSTFVFRYALEITLGDRHHAY
jgi:hypothetical protein